MIAFVQKGLNDLSITRTNIQWGIPAPVEGHHVFYVWFDALISYMSAVKDDDLWPADLHLIGKDILRFHAVYWPAFLMAADLPLPKQVFAHGWILHEENKMSKSRGNVVRPGPIVDVVGADALRYFLLREITFGQDGSFSYDALIQRYNADLANGLGNLASRTLTHDPSVSRRRDSGFSGVARHRRSRAPDHRNDDGRVLRFQLFARSGNAVGVHFRHRQIHRGTRALETWQGPVRIRSKACWTRRCTRAAEALRIICAWIYPVMPDSARNIWIQLGMTAPIESVDFRGSALGQVAGRTKDRLGCRRVSRAWTRAAIGKMELLEVQEKARQAELFGAAKAAASPAAAPEAAARSASTISSKVDLRVGQVVSAERVKGADKLLHMKVDIGEAAAAHHRRRNRRIVPARADDRPQSGDRRQSAAAQAARHRIERHDRGGVARRRQAGAGGLPRRCARGSALEVSLEHD